jgi:predicted DNA-binding transcriptional regulator YafY
MRADRLMSLILELQARGRTTASVLAAELEVSVRTVYRDLAALGAAGVPVVTESGPGGGCQLLDDYRFPLRGLRPDEAEALLILGIPAVFGDLGLDRALSAAQRHIKVTSGAGGPSALLHLDMPRWFGAQEEAPALTTVAQAVRLGRRLSIRYRDAEESRAIGPLGLVNKAGIWYLVAMAGEPAQRAEPAQAGEPTQAAEQGILVFRASRISSAHLLSGPVERPAGFELAAFWARWSAEFTASRPRLSVSVRAAPDALAIFPEVFGDGVREALNDASEPDERGWRVVTLSFEHEMAAAHRLAGFGGAVEVIQPPGVRTRLLGTARAIIGMYRNG